MTALERVAQAFGAHGVRYLVLKGAALLGGEYPTLAGRRTGDVDLLIAEADRPRAVAALAEIGAVERAFHDRSRPATDRAYFEVGYDLTVAGVRVSLDVHTHLIWPEAYPIDNQRLFAAAQAHPLPDLAALGARRPAPEHMLLHLALHRLKSYYDGDRRNYDDAARLLRAYSIDKVQLCADARAWGLSVVLYIFLLGGQRMGIFDSAVDALVAATRPGPCRRAAIAAVLDLAQPQPFRWPISVRARQVLLFALCCHSPAAAGKFPGRYLGLRGRDLVGQRLVALWPPWPAKKARESGPQAGH
jgi:hypothetical protein